MAAMVPLRATRAMAENPTDPAGPVSLELPAGVHQLCRCGRSRHGWVCDGAHLGTGQVSFELRLEQAATIRLCGCGRSQRFPLCDGSHGRPSRRPWWRWPKT